jgi:hypothetical protein
MALTTVNLSGLATGAKPGLIEQATVNITSAVASVSLTSLSTDFDAFVINAHIYPASDNTQLYCGFLDSAGNLAGYHSTAKFGFYYDSNGTGTLDYYDPVGRIGKVMGASSATSTLEGMRLNGTLLGRNFVYNGATESAPVFLGNYQSQTTGTACQGGSFYVSMDGYGGNAETIAGIKFYMSSGNIADGYFRIYGMSGT